MTDLNPAFEDSLKRRLAEFNLKQGKEYPKAIEDFRTEVLFGLRNCLTLPYTYLQVARTRPLTQEELEKASRWIYKSAETVDEKMTPFLDRLERFSRELEELKLEVLESVRERFTEFGNKHPL
jgi:hypothetical protein